MNRNIQPIKAWLTDMDGVLIREGDPIPGANEFINALREQDIPFLVLTNNPIQTPRDLSARLANQGIEVPEENIWTAALATATFMQDQMPNGTAFVIGEAGLTTAIHEAGFTLTDVNPDYVVLGETRNYSYDTLSKASRLIRKGARFICTNPDATSPSAEGELPSTGALASLVRKASGKKPYFVGKPNPMMFRSALNRINAHSESTAMIGDRMNTDVVAGIEAGMRTYLVMTGSTTVEEMLSYPFRPTEVMGSIADLVPFVGSAELPTSDYMKKYEQNGENNVTYLAK